MATKKNKSSASLGLLVTELQSSVDVVYSNELKMDTAKNTASIQNMPWLSLSGNDVWAREKGWFALTVGRASFKRQPLLDEVQLAEALVMEISDVAPGYYLMDPNGKVAAAYISDMLGGREDGKSAWKTFESKTLKMMKKSGAVSDETFITKIEVDPKVLMRRANQFADAMGIDFADNALDLHGVSVKSKRLDELNMTGGYAAAWTIESAKVGYCDTLDDDQTLADASIGMEVIVSFGDLSAAPYNNHAANSLMKNIRDLSHVNNTDSGGGANQLKARDEIVQTLAKAWLAQIKAPLGLLDKEAGFDPKLCTKESLEKKREQLAKSHRNPFGNEKKMAIKPSETVVRLGKDKTEKGSSSIQFISRDMAFIDGQHSSRNYALIAAAFTSGKSVYYNEPGEGLVLVESCNVDHFSNILSSFVLADAKVGKKTQKVKAWTQLGFADEASAFESFKSFSIEHAKATIKTVPVFTREQALSLVKIVNSSTPQSKASQAEHDLRPEIKKLVDAYNEVAIRLGDPTRMSMTKSASSDPDFATDVTLTKSFQDYFASISAGCVKVNNVGENISERNFDYAKKALAVMKVDSTSDNVTKLAALHQMAGKIKSRDYMMSGTSASRLVKAVGGILNDLSAFSALTMQSAMKQQLSGKGTLMQYDGASPEERVYMLCKSAFAFQEQLDMQWKRVSGQNYKDNNGVVHLADKSLVGVFETKATFVNWMIIGTLQQFGEIATPKALMGIKGAVDNLQELAKHELMESSKKLGLSFTHNDAREAFVKAQDSGNGPLANWTMASLPELKRFHILLSAMPGIGDAPIKSLSQEVVEKAVEKRLKDLAEAMKESKSETTTVSEADGALASAAGKLKAKKASFHVSAKSLNKPGSKESN